MDVAAAAFLPGLEAFFTVIETNANRRISSRVSFQWWPTKNELKKKAALGGTFLVGRAGGNGLAGNYSHFEKISHCCVKLAAAASCSCHCSTPAAAPISSSSSSSTSSKTSDCPFKHSDRLNQTNSPWELLELITLLQTAATPDSALDLATHFDRMVLLFHILHVFFLPALYKVPQWGFFTECCLRKCVINTNGSAIHWCWTRSCPIGAAGAFLCQ